MVSAGHIAYQMVSREPPKEEDLENQKGAIRERLLNQKRQLAFEVFQDNLWNRLTASGELQIYEDAVDQLATAYR